MIKMSIFVQIHEKNERKSPTKAFFSYLCSVADVNTSQCNHTKNLINNTKQQ